MLLSEVGVTAVADRLEPSAVDGLHRRCQAVVATSGVVELEVLR
jgi:hypothetical protein